MRGERKSPAPCRGNRWRKPADIYAGLDPAQREAAYESFIWRNLKRNYAGHYVHGMLGMTGFRLVNAPTFVPAYLHLLSGSDVAVGSASRCSNWAARFRRWWARRISSTASMFCPVSMILGTMMRVQILGWRWPAMVAHGTPLLVL
jgi:hypothetical protein